MPVYTSSIEVTADYPTIKPSLNLNFARSRALDPRITFTRASTATYVGRDGLIKTAGEDEARFDHDPDTLESLGLLIEESRTNSLPYSSDIIGQANWAGAGVSAVAATSITAPDGSTDTVGLRDDGSNGQHTLYDDVSVSNITSTYTASCWVKAGTQNYAELFSNGGGTAGTITIGYKYDLVNKTTEYTGTAGFVTGTSATITEYPNGWFRITLTGDVADTATGSGTYRWHVRAETDSSGNYQGDNTDGIYIWGPQLELGSFATSYIPTTSAAVTRAGDFGVINGTSFTNIFNYNEGTFSTKVRINGYNPTSYPRPFMFALQSSPGADFWQLVFNNSGQNFFTETRENTGTPRSNSAVSVAAGVDVIVTSAVKNGEGLTSYYGGSIRTNSFGSISPSIDSLTFNQYNYNGTISNLSYYPQRLTDAQLQLLTS